MRGDWLGAGKHIRQPIANRTRHLAGATPSRKRDGTFDRVIGSIPYQALFSY
jgi:hypothetical protein